MADCFRPGGNNPLAREVNDRSELAGQELNRRASGPGFAGLTDREDDNQGRAFARLAAGRNAAAVTLNELPADGQSNARAFIFAPAMQALKDGKDPVRSFLVKANPLSSIRIRQTASSATRRSIFHRLPTRSSALHRARRSQPGLSGGRGRYAMNRTVSPG